MGAITLVLGGAPLGNLYTPISDDQAAATVQRAWELGVRQFDTAPHYGLGLSEIRMGEALRPLLRQEPEAQISTKVGRLLRANPNYHEGDLDPENFAVPARTRRQWDCSASGLRQSVEESLERLGMDHVDTLYLHDPDVYDLQDGIRHGLPALMAMREEGLVKRIGVGANSDQALLACVQEADLDLIMCAGRYTLLDQPAQHELLPTCLDRGVSVVAAGVYNSGALATAYPPNPEQLTFDYAPAPAHIKDKVARLYAVCAAHGVTVPQAAVQFPARHPAIETVVLGARSAAEIEQGVANSQAAIPQSLWDDLSEQDLI